MIKRRTFLKNASVLATTALLPSCSLSSGDNKRLRIAQIGVGGMGASDLNSISSHKMVDVVGLCDVDSNALRKSSILFPNAKTYSDYRVLLNEMSDRIDAVVVSTPDHTHAPASLMAMNLNKAVYCQKPLTHHISEAREMYSIAKEKKLVTQMGIQVHSFYDYKLATLLIKSGIIGRVSRVHAWSPKNWGYDGPIPSESHPVPSDLDWNLWLGTAKKREYNKDFYHPFGDPNFFGNWRKLVDFGCGTLGDMGVHIFDTPYNALELDVPKTVTNECREPNDFSFPEKNKVTYVFPGTKQTTDELKWIWYDGIDAPENNIDLELPNNEKLHDQGAMFIGEKGRLYLPHFMIEPRLIVDGQYQKMDIEKFNLGEPVRDYSKEEKFHYHEFVDACLGKGNCSAPFSYGSKLTETILLGVIAGRFPGETLNWDKDLGEFKEKKANIYISGSYRDF